MNISKLIILIQLLIFAHSTVYSQLVFNIKYNSIADRLDSSSVSDYKKGLDLSNKMNYEQALKYYYKAANKGHSDAMLSIGNLYYNGFGVPKDLSEAKKWYELAAVYVNPVAMYNLGFMYEKGLGTYSDINEALSWYTKSRDFGYLPADIGVIFMYSRRNYVNSEARLKDYIEGATEGHPKAMEFLGHFYFGEPVSESRDYSEALKWYLLAAEKGNYDAMNYVGFMYENGLGVEPSQSEALKWYQSAAENGSDKAAYNLAELYGRDGALQAYNKAATWFRVAAEKGNHNAMNTLGTLYMKGMGIAKDYSEALKWFSQGSSSLYFHPCYDACYNLGQLYQQGLGVEKNIGEALKHYQMAADRGHTLASLKIGEYYEIEAKNDENLHKDAYSWYSKAAENGNGTALGYLGRMNFYGEGVFKSHLKALGFFNDAVNKGNFEAADFLGYMYRNGEGVSKDVNEALKWFMIAHDEGSSIAAAWIGDIYLLEEEVRNYTKAFEWFKHSVENKNTSGISRLALMYEHGLGVEKNLEEALKYHTLAAESGETEYILNLADFYYFDVTGVFKNYKEAFNYYSIAADKGDINALKRLAFMNLHGIGTQQNISDAQEFFSFYAILGNQCLSDIPELIEISKNKRKGDHSYSNETVQLFKIAVEKNDHASMMKLYNILGLSHCNDNTLNDWLWIASELGNNDAIVEVALHFIKNFNFTNATILLKKASENGFADAHFYLGQIYSGNIYDNSYMQDYALTLEHFEYAATKGNKDAMRSLANMYSSGMGVEKDAAKADFWNKKAR